MSSTYGFSFRINEFEWNKFHVREFVSLLTKVLRYCIGGLVLYGSTMLSKSVTYCAFCLSDVFCWTILSVFAFSALDHVDEVFGCTCDCLLDMMYLACVFGCT